jgi:hypothetical protein
MPSLLYFHVNISVGVGGNAMADRMSRLIASDCVRQEKLAIGWGYWSDTEITTPTDQPGLARRQKQYFLDAFNAATDFDSDDQIQAARVALNSVTDKVVVGSRVALYLPGHGYFGFAEVVGEYVENDTPLFPHPAGSNFHRTRKLRFRAAAAVVDNHPICLHVTNWVISGTKFVPSPTIKPMDAMVFQHFERQMTEKLLVREGVR